MSAGPPSPRLDEVVAALNGAGAQFVLIGGFAVVAHRYVRATQDVDILVGDDAENDRRVIAALRSLSGVRARDRAPLSEDHLLGSAHLRALTSAGLVDVVREGNRPLDFETVAKKALRADLGSGDFLIAGLASLVALKRLSARPHDRRDLEELEAIHGELPSEPLPELDER